MKILIPAEYTIEYEQLTLRYLRLGRLALTFAEWKMLFTAFDLLHRAVVEVNESAMSFRAVYQDHVDRPFADQYIHALLQLVNVTQERNTMDYGHNLPAKFGNAYRLLLFMTPMWLSAICWLHIAYIFGKLLQWGMPSKWKSFAIYVLLVSNFRHMIFATGRPASPPTISWC